DLERIEVMKSPGSVLFGSGALGGAIQMITRRAPFAAASRWSGEWTEGVSAVDGGASHALSAERSAERTALRVSAAYRDGDDTSTPRGDLLNSKYTDWNLGTSLGVRTWGGQSLFASWQRSQAENTGIPGGSPFAATATATYRLAMRERFALEYLLPNLTARLPLLTVRLSHQDIARNVEILQSPTVTVTPHATHATASAQVESRLLPATNHVLTVGAEAWQRRLDSRRERVLAATNRTVGERPVPRSSNASAGLYAQDDWTVAHDRLRVVLGARRDWSRTRNDATLNPDYVIIGGIRQEPTPGQTLLWSAGSSRDQSWDASAGLHAQLAPVVAARLLVATAYRSPSLEERYQYLDLGGVLHVGDPQLRPERSRSVNLGARAELRSLTLDADVFLNALTDLVTETAGTFQGRSAFVKTNVGEARLYGFECSAELRLGARHAVSASLASVRGEDTGRHVELPQVAPIAAGAEWSVDGARAGTLRVGLTATHAQDRPAPDEARTAGWTTWRAAWTSAPWNAARASFRVRAGCDNLFDRAYRRHLSTLRGLVRLEPGRAAWLSVNASFGGAR
ncbi:MAG: TonB-dependent receptor, partial [Candidatus Eisenbacteria bacterium]|nr:TonB-dependent receptor [Candidatus Eisenbacteria bacterium]